MTVAQGSVVVLVRAWRDEDGIRGVVTLEGGVEGVRTVAASSVESLCGVVRDALERWARAGDATNRGPGAPGF